MVDIVPCAMRSQIVESATLAVPLA